MLDPLQRAGRNSQNRGQDPGVTDLQIVRPSLILSRCGGGCTHLPLQKTIGQQAPFDEASDPIPQLVSTQSSLPEQMPPRWPEWIALLVYASLVASAISTHEPWADEAQAWQMARSLSLPALFHTHLRYEGSPGLWHLLLWILNRAHISYSGMHWFCGVLALAATSVFVLWSPFPRYLRLSLPFTYFLLFQYAVVARSYVLVPGLLFLIASRWKKSPVVMALLLGLLANLALHAAVISAALAILYAAERIREGNLREPATRRKLCCSMLLLLGFYAFVLWTAWPPHDLLFSRVRGESRSSPEFAIASLVWGVCQPWPLSILFWIAIAVCFRARQALFYLLPVLCFACFCGVVYANWWHVGLLVPLLLCLLWITWPAPGCTVSRQERIGRAALTLMAATQILWSAYALAYDHSHAYSPDLAAAQFLTPYVQSGASIAVTYLDEPEGNQAYDSVGILPYFDHNIYMNQPQFFWFWNTDNPTEDRFFKALPSRPRIVLVEIRKPDQDHLLTINSRLEILKKQKLEILTKAGYRMTNIFCGIRAERFQLSESSCHEIFQQSPTLQNPAAGGSKMAALSGQGAR
jgi:hypothetical protein